MLSSIYVCVVASLFEFVPRCRWVRATVRSTQSVKLSHWTNISRRRVRTWTSTRVGNRRDTLYVLSFSTRISPGHDCDLGEHVTYWAHLVSQSVDFIPTATKRATKPKDPKEVRYFIKSMTTCCMMLLYLFVLFPSLLSSWKVRNVTVANGHCK